MELVQIDKEVLDMMFDTMNYQSELIALLSKKFQNIQKGRWMTTEEVAKFLCVSERKVRLLKSSGRIGFIKNGKACLYRSEDVLSLVTKNNNA